jgi:hypothetical protein
MSHRELKKVRINWERLKEFIGDEFTGLLGADSHTPLGGALTEVKRILAEIERLEEGR